MTIMTSRRAPRRFNVAEAKARFAELVRKAMSGEEVVIAKDNKPVLRLVPFERAGEPRKAGSARGRVWMAPDFDEAPADFDDYR